jgi:ribonuclease R
VYCEPSRDGFRLVVAIADVSHYVRPGTRWTWRRPERATSVYFPGFVVPMLPEKLSNGICSLKPKVDRLCFVCDMQVSRAGEVTRAKFYEAVMHSHARLTYTQVWNALDPAHRRPSARRRWRPSAQLPQVERLHQLYQRPGQGAREARRDRVRDQRGAVRARGRRERWCRPACSSATTRTS